MKKNRIENHLFPTLFLVLLITVSCQQNTNEAVKMIKINKYPVLICDIDKITETREMKLSELVESSELIRLEKKTESLMNATWFKKVAGDFLFFSDIQNKLFLFDENGRFVKIWKPGQGPFEFVMPEQPQIIDSTVYVYNRYTNKLLNYNLDNTPPSAIDLMKKNGNILIVKNEGLISIGNSTSIDDPFLICQQDFDGKTLQTFSAKTHINLEPSVVFENVTTYPTQNGWNIHFPTNDTLMHYNPVENTLEPVAIFYSQSHVNSNKEFYVAREKYGLNIDKKAFEMPVIVIPEYESEQFYFISIIRYGEQNELPWYFSSRKMALVDKKSNKAFYISLINDFWGDIPFQLQGTSQIWEKCFIQDFPAIEVKKQFGDLLEKNDGKMNESTQLKIEKLVAKTNNEDNSIIFRYTLK